MDSLDDARATDAVIDRGVLDQLLEDVGPENAEAVLDAFVQELARQTVALEVAAAGARLDGMAHAAHRLKSTAASFGATRLSRVVEFIEQAARGGDRDAAAGRMSEFRVLAKASRQQMDSLFQELFGAPNKPD